MEPHNSSSGGGSSDPKVKRAASPAPSCVSWKSDWSIDPPPALSSAPVPCNPKVKRAASPAPSCVSWKSDWSIDPPPALSSAPVPCNPKGRGDLLQVSSCGVCEQVLTDPVSITCGHRFCRQCISSYWDQSAPSRDFSCPQCRKRFRTRPVLHPHKDMEVSIQQDSRTPVDDVLHTHKTCMKNKYESLFEGTKSQENKTLLNRVYTQLYIIDGESEGVNEEHEVLQMEKTLRKQLVQDTPIYCSDIFKPVQGPEGEMTEGVSHTETKEDKGPEVPELKTVLTKGIAGIGKTVSVQKFILDWAEGKANQDVDFMFVLPFRELNLVKDDQYSLHRLLCDFHPEIKDLDPKIYDVCKFVFIFDGLDESRIQLNFSQCNKVSEISMTSSVGVLTSNLIKGELLPSALIWITSRPAAANQIPPHYINRVTEIQGFTDPQKEEYFRKRISDQDQAEKIISHIKTAKSLHIMCHIPVFCWISATVLQEILKQTDTEIPKTLTEMYIQFLHTQINMKNEKYEGKKESDQKKYLESNRSMILKLAELAFKHLMEGNVMFYEEDLRECGIDVTEASVYSGICTEIFREESVLYQRKVYCFVHLSFQEFFAALYVFHCYVEKNMEVLKIFLCGRNKSFPEVSLDVFLKSAVNKALKSPKGELDLFLRFLHGISLESNQKLLHGLLTPTQSSPESVKKIIQNLRLSQKQNVSPERFINLTHCLIEMKDTSLHENIQKFLKEESSRKLTLAQCSALAFQLQMSEEVLDELSLKKYKTTLNGFWRLLPAVSNCRRALLAHCNLTAETCKMISSVLQTANLPLRELDLSHNELQDSGVEHLSAGLNSSHCKVEILRLAHCNLTAETCKMISSVLQTANLPLRELDLSRNELQDSGVEHLSAGLKSSHCKVEILRLAHCSLTAETCKLISSVLQTANLPLRELDLSRNELQDSGVEHLSAGLKSSHCKVEILRLAHCNLTAETCKMISSVLQTANLPLRELDLSHNELQDSGVEHLSAGLNSSHCKVEILRLSGCLVTEEGCSSLASALRSNPSHLKELDLTYNHPGESGVNLLSARLEDPHCRLDTLKYVNTLCLV
ncbi:NACHT, LRR and PYD domains-containing protein 12-like isoform X2 [Electrophorus electricus]|uniref:NACHT, LRR and PYD domains-containing protein 12-like isoform X2 n=1 Tax=Electrophorus electricus TaxID=8005 RepID=UPI0015CFA826|nr:NACHT, LRR and PYD domains-containing protein 12-like isoform X2 [Electrophorus electricus]